MKKFLFIIVCVLTFCFAVSACSKGGDGAKSYTGEYGYEQYGSKYGVKVSVRVKDGVIESVEILDSDYLAATPQDIWDGKSVWDDGLDALLESYKGKEVSFVTGQKVAVKSDGEPYTNDDEPEEKIDYGGLVITGATMGSGRLLLAVQNALKKI